MGDSGGETAGDIGANKDVEGDRRARTLLIVIPLIFAPLAFYYNRNISDSSSILLEIILILILVAEFSIILLSKSGPFAKMSLFGAEGATMEQLILEIECAGCGFVSKYNHHENEAIYCRKCESVLEIEI